MKAKIFTLLISLFFISIARAQLKIGQKYQGGILVYEKNGHGLVAAPKDLGIFILMEAGSACENLVLNGFSDWRLPSKEELSMLYRHREEIGGFVNGAYWSSNYNNMRVTDWILNFPTGEFFEWDFLNALHVRAVRSFSPPPLPTKKLPEPPPSKEVSITSSGSGKTLEDAKQAALRSSTEQAFGAFISSKIEIFNDQVVADQMASVSSGNIKSYEVLNKSQLPDSSWGVTLKTIVSVDKLTSFVKAKGIVIEIKGNMFVSNIEQQLLNEQGEIKAVSKMVELLHEPMQISFDYIISRNREPLFTNNYAKIPLHIAAITNKNIDFCANYCINTLAALSLSSEEVISYQSSNKAVFPVVIEYNGVAKTFYLRKQSSINALNTLTRNWEFYTRLFTVQYGMDELNYIDGDSPFRDGLSGSSVHLRNFTDEYMGMIHFFSSYNYFNNNVETINFLTTGQKAAGFSWYHNVELSERQMPEYKVKPRGVVSQFKHGGFLVTSTLEVKHWHGPITHPRLSIQKVGLVAAFTDLGTNAMDWNSAKSACDELILNGYSDWHLPSKEELEVLHLNLHKKGVGGFKNSYYWSSTESGEDDGEWWIWDFQYAQPHCEHKSYKNYVRCVRTFLP